MNNPFKTSGGGAGALVSPASVDLSKKEEPRVETKPYSEGKSDSQGDEELKISQESVEEISAKRPWWKFWGNPNQESQNPDKGEELNLPLERKLTEKEKAEERHDALVKSVDNIFRVLDETKDRPLEFKSQDILPPIPVENIDALTKSTEQVSGALAQVSGHLENVEKRDDLMVQSLSRVDDTLGSLQRVNERSLTAMDSLKSVLSGVKGTMNEMRQENRKSTKRYEELVERVQEKDAEHAAEMSRLQKRTLWITITLGLGVIGCLIALVAN